MGRTHDGTILKRNLNVLAAVQECGGEVEKLKDLADYLDEPRHYTSGAVNSLAQSGYVETEYGQSKQIWITDKGRKLLSVVLNEGKELEFSGDGVDMSGGLFAEGLADKVDN